MVGDLWTLMLSNGVIDSFCTWCPLQKTTPVKVCWIRVRISINSSTHPGTTKLRVDASWGPQSPQVIYQINPPPLTGTASTDHRALPILFCHQHAMRWSRAPWAPRLWSLLCPDWQRLHQSMHPISRVVIGSCRRTYAFIRAEQGARASTPHPCHHLPSTPPSLTWLSVCLSSRTNPASKQIPFCSIASRQQHTSPFGSSSLPVLTAPVLRVSARNAPLSSLKFNYLPHEVIILNEIESLSSWWTHTAFMGADVVLLRGAMAPPPPSRHSQL